MQSTTVTVRMTDAPYQADNSYTYLLPSEMFDRVFVGSFVLVPFGAGNRPCSAVVTALSHADDDFILTSDRKTLKLKPVLSVLQERFPLTKEQLGLCSFLCETTLCSFGDAVHAILPAAAFAELAETYSATGSGEPQNEEEAAIVGYLGQKGETEAKVLLSVFGEDTPELLRRMKNRGLVARDYSVKETKNDKKVKFYSLSVDESEASRIASGESTRLRSEAQRRIVGYILTYGKTDRDTLKKQISATPAQLSSLCEKGILSVCEEEEYRNPYLSRSSAPRDKNILSEEQTAAYKVLEGLYESGEPRAALLFGVTGSGKTRVIKSMVDRVLTDGRRVIILVPEISLTPQTVDIFCGFYGSRVAVIHSSLSAGERFDAYKRILRGQADVVIGTRSAVFAPLDNIGLIVIDEEQEHTYKSDTSPKYHAKDIARYRAKTNNALMLLASATPSLESYYRAKTGKYTLVELKSRYGGAELPSVSVVDMRKEGKAGNLSPISEPLLRLIAKTKDEGRQSILFLNRRGYNHFAICRTCGEVVECPNCSISLTYHVAKGADIGEDPASRAKAGYLYCHYCGYRREVPLLCPSCSSQNITFLGYGTQRVEKELTDTFSGMRVLRMDTDTTQGKFSYEKLLGSFRRKEADLLLGTQMVTKGHDFPSVTLVGVLDADSALHLDDYRAGERTFSLITQVIGRAGRGEFPGVAVIQTHLPDNETIKLACAQDYEGFYRSEIVLREKYLFPPFCDIALITMTCTDEESLHKVADEVSTQISTLAETEFKDVPLMAYGPFESPIYKMSNRYRLRMVFKCRQNARMRELFSRVLKTEHKNIKSSVSIAVDINPTGI